MRYLAWALILPLFAGEDKPAVEVSVERKGESGWQLVDSRTVFEANDEIRFRFRTQFPGYLYVLNRNANGESDWLFPKAGRDQTNRVEPGAPYLIPGTSGSFVVGGTPGYDVTLWMVSSRPLDSLATAVPQTATQPSTLLPRCREEILQSRGLCVDSEAGPRPSRASSQLKSRDLTFREEDNKTTITAANSKPGVFVYEFRIAHR